MGEIIAAAATASAPSALAVVRLSGEGASSVARRFVRLSELPARRARLGRADWGGPIDDVMVTFFPGPRSATGEDLVEISCHGSPLVVSRLLEAAVDNGARLARPGEFTLRAYLNGKLDLAQAEAVGDLISARTKAAHQAALRRLQGGLSQALEACRGPVLELLVRLEAALDHPEEDIPAPVGEDFAREAASAARMIERLAATFDRGRLLREGARVAIVGRPNAGKSSLLNALLGRERAIVCPTPGTTRDTLEEPADLLGRSSILIDTAGLRETVEDPAERIGVERAEAALRDCDLALLVIDGSRPSSAEDRRAHDRILALGPQGRAVVTVLSKADQPRLEASVSPEALAVSSVTRDGLEELARRIARRLAPEAEEESPVLVASLRHRDALRRAAEGAFEAGRAPGLWPGAWQDRAASRLRGALRALDEIRGAGAPDEVLAGIFSRFCVGK